jgi:hypothetical protein
MFLCLECGAIRFSIDDIDCACYRFASSPWGPIVLDLRGRNISELPEVGKGMAFLSTSMESDGRKKITLMSADPIQVRTFMEKWAPAHKLTGIYGDPERGFAEGFCP